MSDPQGRRSWKWAGGPAVALLTLAILVATEPRLAIVWDEGYTLGREARLRDWFRALRDPSAFAATWKPPALELIQPDVPPMTPPRPDQLDTRAELFAPRALDWFWPFARAEPHGHPPFYALVGLVGDIAAPGWDVLPRARLGPMIAFALAAGAIYSAVARRWGPWAGSLSAGAWVLQPNLFGHGHYATYDALLTSLWVGSILTFARAVETPGRWPRWGWAIGFGLVAGCAADTKFTAWLLPMPFLAWSAAGRSRRGWITLGVGGLVGIAILYALNPPWWADPIAGVARFVRSNLTRGITIPIPVLFLGEVVLTPRQSLPWYNTLVWTALVTPVLFLLFALAGVTRAIAKDRTKPLAVLAALHWTFLLALRALPHMPGHDGVRQFLPAFGCLALAAGPGAAWAVERFGAWGRGLVAAALVEGVASVALMMPVPLSYFSPIVGGLPGAARLGMEPTYYWDGLTGEALDWLNAQTKPGDTVAFSTFPTSWLYLHDSGRLKADLSFGSSDSPSWFVIQNRPGAFGWIERAIVGRKRPSFVVEKLGVPLVWIYPNAEVLPIFRPDVPTDQSF